MQENVNSARFISVLEDRKGNFWFATLGSGVIYYDGKSFRKFTTGEGLASNQVFCIYEDRAGNIWFGTNDGASRYDGKSFRNIKMTEAPAVTAADSMHSSVYQHPLPEGSALHNDIHTIIEDKSGKSTAESRNRCVRILKAMPDYWIRTHTNYSFTVH